MKKLFFILAVLTAASCTKGTAPATEMKTISVELGYPGIEDNTKSVLVDGTHVYWTAQDVNILCITTDDSKYLLTSDETTQKAVKRFTGEIPADKEPLLYYYDANSSTGNFNLKTGHKIREILNRQQECDIANSFPKTLNYAIAQPGDASFKNVHGYFKWTNNGNAIKSVKFETITEGEYLAGWFDVRYEDGELVTTKYNFAGASATACSPYVLSKIVSDPIPADKSYYAIIIPGTYHGLQVTVTLVNGSSFVLKTEETIIVERGKYIDFGVMPTAPVTIQTGSFTLSAGQDYEEGWTLDF